MRIAPLELGLVYDVMGRGQDRRHERLAQTWDVVEAAKLAQWYSKSGWTKVRVGMAIVENHRAARFKMVPPPPGDRAWVKVFFEPDLSAIFESVKAAAKALYPELLKVPSADGDRDTTPDEAVSAIADWLADSHGVSLETARDAAMAVRQEYEEAQTQERS
jgi:hypothetical protein